MPLYTPGFSETVEEYIIIRNLRAAYPTPRLVSLQVKDEDGWVQGCGHSVDDLNFSVQERPPFDVETH